jgi:hypothetical protein
MPEDLTQDRVELKYVALPDEVDGILADLRALAAQPGFRVDQAWITTVYFDLPDGRLARRTLAGGPRTVKVRMREYLPPQGSRESSSVFIEVKVRDGSTSRKARFPLEKARVAPFFRGQGDPDLALDGSDFLAEGVRRVRRIAGGGPLLAVGAASYRRLAVEGGHPRARITLDRQISYHLGSFDLYEESPALDRQALGPPAVEDAGGIAELKFRGPEPPPWGERLLRSLPAVEFSKFLALSALALSEAQAAHVDRLSERRNP